MWKMSPIRDTPLWFIVANLSHSQSLHLLLQSRHSLNTVVSSSAELTCFAMENILLPPHLKQVYNEFSKASCDFSCCLIKHFIFSLAESKTGCSKIGSIFLLTFWINKGWPKGQTEMNFVIDFVLNKKWQKKRKK